MTIVRTGRWLANLLHDRCLPADDMPSRRHLTWWTKAVRQEQVEHYWSEPGRTGVVPCVEAWLFRIDVTRRLGPPVKLWRTEVAVQMFIEGAPANANGAAAVATFERHRSFAGEVEAGRDFALHLGGVRTALTGSSRTPYEEAAAVASEVRSEGNLGE